MLVILPWLCFLKCFYSIGYLFESSQLLSCYPWTNFSSIASSMNCLGSSAPCQHLGCVFAAVHYWDRVSCSILLSQFPKLQFSQYDRCQKSKCSWCSMSPVIFFSFETLGSRRFHQNEIQRNRIKLKFMNIIALILWRIMKWNCRSSNLTDWFLLISEHLLSQKSLYFIAMQFVFSTYDWCAISSLE